MSMQFHQISLPDLIDSQLGSYSLKIIGQQTKLTDSHRSLLHKLDQVSIKVLLKDVFGLDLQSRRGAFYQGLVLGLALQLVGYQSLHSAFLLIRLLRPQSVRYPLQSQGLELVKHCRFLLLGRLLGFYLLGGSSTGSRSSPVFWCTKLLHTVFLRRQSGFSRSPVRLKESFFCHNCFILQSSNQYPFDLSAQTSSLLFLRRLSLHFLPRANLANGGYSDPCSNILSVLRVKIIYDILAILCGVQLLDVIILVAPSIFVKRKFVFFVGLAPPLSQADLKDCIRLNLVEEPEFFLGVLVVPDHVEQSLVLVLTLFSRGFVHSNIFNVQKYDIIRRLQSTIASILIWNQIVYYSAMEQKQAQSLRTQVASTSDYQHYLKTAIEKLEQRKITHKTDKNSYLHSIFRTKAQLDQEMGGLKENVRKAIKEVTPTVQEKQTILFALIQRNPQLYRNSFDRYFCCVIAPSARPLLWVARLYNQTYIEGFKKVDKKLLEITEFEQDFSIRLEKTTESMRTQINQKERGIIKRLLEGCYRISKSSDPSSYNLCILLVKTVKVDLELHQIGGCFLSLVNLGNHFNDPSSDAHLEKLYQALELIDQQSYHKLRQYNQKQFNKKRFLKVLKSFLRSIGTSFLQIEVSQFLVDSILILGDNRMNMYIAFSVVVMILCSGSEEEDFVRLIEGETKSIRLDKFKQVFKVIYDGINITKLKNKEWQKADEEQQEYRDKTAVCQLLEQQYSKHEEAEKMELESFGNSRRSFHIETSDPADLAGIVPILVNTSKL